MLRDHKEWVKLEGWVDPAIPGRARLCRADLHKADLHKADLSKADLSEADLSEADLSEADLSGADLSGADLSEADLSGADLRKANLRKAILSRTDLSEANLSWADLRKANLSGARLLQAWLREADLSGAALRKANLSGAHLFQANLSEADLSGADLTGANLSEADLSEADLSGADLSGAHLRRANLRRAVLGDAFLSLPIQPVTEIFGAELGRGGLFKGHNLRAVPVTTDLRKADLSGADLRKANLRKAILSEARLLQANLSEADLSGADLSGADLSRTDLSGADLSGAKLSGAILRLTEIKDSNFTNVDLTDATYEPVSAPSSRHVSRLSGLTTVTFGLEQHIGLVLLRKALQEAGLREAERQATFAIEHGRTRHALKSWREDFGTAVEGALRLVFFEWTTGYGYHFGRPIVVLFGLIGLFMMIYMFPISGAGTSPGNRSGIYRILPRDRIEETENGIELREDIKAVRLLENGRSGLAKSTAVFRYALYFSLLSAFHIGWRELNVGSWLTRLQGREYALRAGGWVRVVSGIQSLVSVYLLAIWALTYFGRPFQ
jgi:uncharacterized protein YjbI with pentapeptide repeats